MTAKLPRWVPAIVALVGAAIVTRRMAGFFVDDAYITMRFARNLVDGHGWTYNVGEDSANGATSPGFTLAVAALTVPLRAATRAANALFVGSFAAVAALLTHTYRSGQGTWVGLLTVVMMLACPWLVATKGMESLPFLALVCAVLWAHENGHDGWLGLSAVVLVLVRGEGILLVACVLGWSAVVDRRVPWRALLSAALAAGPWLLYSGLVLRSLVPNTLGAKMAQGRSGYWGEGRIFFSGFWELLDMYDSRAWLTLVVPLATGGLIRGCLDTRLRSTVVPLVSATVLHLVAYGLVLNVPAYHWYYAWELFTLALLAALSLAWVLDQATAAPWMTVTWARAVAGVMVTSSPLVVAIQVPADGKDIDQYKEVPLYQELGLWLAANTPADARIAATEIGTIGWFSERPIVDYLGLLSTESSQELAHGDLRSWLRRETPDYWVVHDPAWVHEQPAMSDPWFSSAYQPIRTTTIGPRGYRLVVYQRTINEAPSR